MECETQIPSISDLFALAKRAQENDFQSILALADDIKQNPKQYSNLSECDYRILAQVMFNCFFFWLKKRMESAEASVEYVRMIYDYLFKFLMAGLRFDLNEEVFKNVIDLLEITYRSTNQSIQDSLHQWDQTEIRDYIREYDFL